MALIRMCVVPNCSQQLSWPILWIVTACATYGTGHTVLLSVSSMVVLTCLQLPTPLSPTHPLIGAICGITVAVKKVAQNPMVLAS